MALKGHLETSSAVPGREEARRAERRALFLETSGRLPGGLEANVVIHNISSSGLLLETELDLAVGEPLVLDIPEIGPVRAAVVWQSELLFGCAFEQALDPSALAAAELRADPPVEAIAPLLEAPVEPFGVKLNRLRRERGLTLAQVAAALGVSKPTVWAWEKGKARPLPDRVPAMAEFLGVPPEELEDKLGSQMHAAVVEECRVRIATAHGTHPSKVRIMIEL
ncbi:MAG: helix-turn-helix domain-containing protein [Pseudomonadota bacterium]